LILLFVNVILSTFVPRAETCSWILRSFSLVARTLLFETN